VTSLSSGPIWYCTVPMPVGQHAESPATCHWYWTLTTGGVQHARIGLGIRRGRAQRDVVVEEQQLRRAGGCRISGFDLHPIQPALASVPTRGLGPAGTGRRDREGVDGQAHGIGCRPVGVGAGVRRLRRHPRRFPAAGGPHQTHQHQCCDQSAHAASLVRAAPLPAFSPYRESRCLQSRLSAKTTFKSLQREAFRNPEHREIVIRSFGCIARRASRRDSAICSTDGRTLTRVCDEGLVR
jgi:hypothetical protein